MSDTPAGDEVKKESGPVPARVAYYLRFRRGGGVFSLSEWRGILEAGDRDAAEAAGEIFERERASLVAEQLAVILIRSDTSPPDPLEAAGRKALEQRGGL